MLDAESPRGRATDENMSAHLTERSPVEDASGAAQSAPRGSFPLPAPCASSHSALPGALSHQAASGGMKLEAVMENLQRQQAARLALEEKLRKAEKEKDLRALVESQIHQQALAFRHYQAAMRGSLAAAVTGVSPAATFPHMEVHRRDEDARSCRPDSDKERTDEEQEIVDDEEEDEDDDDDDAGLNHHQHRQSARPGARLSPRSSPMHLAARAPAAFGPTRRAESPSAQPQPQHHEWTYEEQFKQLYELDDDEKRKEFLDDLFSFMQKRGTPVNRIPIMAKQVLDLYMLYKLVTEKGGLVEVINKKIWREITKGLNLPTSITSAAFTLRTQYMKYLYPYECEKRGLSSPGELQAAIDSNRREGRRQSYGSAIFNYSPAGTPALLSSPKMQMSHLPTLTHNNGHLSQVHGIKKEEPMMAGCLPSRLALPMSPSSHHAAAVAAQAAALEQLREKLEGGEPPEKRMMMVAEEQQRIMQHALQQNLLAMATQLPLNIKLNNRDDRQETALNLSTNGISSINMSIEINGVVYTGALFARQAPMAGLAGHRGKRGGCPIQGKSSPVQFQPSCSSSSSSSSSLHGLRNSSP
ncbi:AT-rich interactive domain-containing protein 3A isoform X2 [Scophthalmus maximus]|uniref:AT-rich interactive domain-containing protein 3 n=1 Tax=Scophthalmus maximus TaxID=52904 RepID=A0A8D3B3E3_SCOMX|nr:AT-rich interactive domain-containing protein 3A isoform X2 [Scophthalmus maximus]